MREGWPPELEQLDAELDDARFREALRMARALTTAIEGLVRARGLDVPAPHEREEEVSRDG